MPETKGRRGAAPSRVPFCTLSCMEAGAFVDAASRGRTRTTRAVLLLCVVTSLGLLLRSSEALATESRPTIDGTSVTNVTETKATIEAQINPQGGTTSYEITLAARVRPPAKAERAEPLQQACGTIPAGSGDVPVSLGLTDLQPGYFYWYEVRANNAAGFSGFGLFWFGFHISGLPPNGEALSYESGRSCSSRWALELLNKESERVRKEYEERQAAKRLAERREREQREAVEAAELRRVAEEQATAKTVGQTHPPCLVPSLRGDTLSAARHALIKRHCRLGRIASPHHHRGPLIVIAQNPRRGRKLASGTAIALTLGPRGHR
jgi:hypothetical protein